MNSWYLGRRQLGQEIEIRVTCTDQSRSPISPDLAPVVIIYNQTGTPVFSSYMQALNRLGKNGMFMLAVILDAMFSEGFFFAVSEWKLSDGTKMVQIQHFQIMPGGNPIGQAISAVWSEIPNFRHIVYMDDRGYLHKGGNPTI